MRYVKLVVSLKWPVRPPLQYLVAMRYCTFEICWWKPTNDLGVSTILSSWHALRVNHTDTTRRHKTDRPGGPLSASWAECLHYER